MKIWLTVVLMIALPAAVAQAEEESLLPSPDEVFAIGTHPSDKKLDYFTPQSLKETLPNLVPGVPQTQAPYQLRPPQRGVIVLKDGTILFWFTQDDQSLFIDTYDSYQAFVVKSSMPQ